MFYGSDANAKTNKEIDEYLKANGYPPSRHGGVSDMSLTWLAILIMFVQTRSS